MLFTFAPVAFAADWTKVKDLQVGQSIRTINGWEKIKSIELLPPEPVYDISISGTHNFVGNGIVAHNTSVNRGVSVNTLLKIGIGSLPLVGYVIGMGMWILAQPQTSVPTEVPTQSPTPTQTPIAKITEAVKKVVVTVINTPIPTPQLLSIITKPPAPALNIIAPSTPEKPLNVREVEAKPANISKTSKGDLQFYIVPDENNLARNIYSRPLNSFAGPGTAAHSEGVSFTGVLAIDNLNMYGAAVQSDGRILLFEADGNPHHQGTFFTLPPGMTVEKINWGTGEKQNDLSLTVLEINGTRSQYEILNAAEHDFKKYPSGCTQAVHPLTDCMMKYNRLELPKSFVRVK